MGHTPVWPGRRVQVQGQVTTPSPSRPPGKALRMGLTPTGDTVLSHVPPSWNSSSSYRHLSSGHMALFAEPVLVHVPSKPARAGGPVAAVPTVQAGDGSRAALGFPERAVSFRRPSQKG